MLISMPKNKNQKELYFDLDWFFRKSSRLDEKIKGIYCIYKDDICLYVGQSKNIASRVATHLSGKYASANKILVYIDADYMEVDGNSDDILLENEKYFMNRLKPTENILVDFSSEINKEMLFSQIQDMENEAPIEFENCHEYIILQDTGSIIMYDIDTMPETYCFMEKTKASISKAFCFNIKGEQ